MSTNNLFKNKYRIPSARLQQWDYSSASAYFITIVTKNRIKYFGEIVNEQMNLTEIGQVAVNEWLKTPQIRPDMNILLGNFVVMPNHFHCLFFIGKNQFNNQEIKNKNSQVNTSKPSETLNNSCNSISKNKFISQEKNVASIIRGFKSSVKSYAIKNNIEFNWQERFHDHIIYDEESLSTISKYILYNPKNWKEDQLYMQ